VPSLDSRSAKSRPSDARSISSAQEPLDSLPATALRRVGERLGQRLAGMGLRTVQDVLFHLPLRYQDRTRITPIGALQPGEHALVQGYVELAAVHRGRRPTLLCRIHDGTGALTLRFFHFRWSQREQFAPGSRLQCYGDVRRGAATLEMVHPEYRFIDRDDAPAPTDALTPIYASTEGVSQTVLRGLAAQALDRLERAGAPGLVDWLPDAVLRPLGLPSLQEALQYVHRPPPDAPVEILAQGQHPAQQRLAFEELLAHHLSLRILRERVRRLRAPAIPRSGDVLARFLAALPFTLTGSQQRVIEEVLQDLGREVPMQRLLQGDVGSGKTVVAACAVLAAVAAGHQVAIMAPTELLAEQHRNSFERWLSPFDLALAWLSGKVKATARRDILERIGSGRAQVVVGTHALFQEGVVFADLGLIIIDEQHRFGVHQRQALREKGRQQGRFPHQLIMTATPIPRTLAMVAYADLDCSVIDELPPGRSPVETAVLSDARRDEVIERVRAACREGRQTYWVCTLIEESEALQCQAAVDTAAQLAASIPELRVGLVHGRMKPAEKEGAMAAFRAGAIDLLVATTVIEVGMDVPNASLMIIENAERLGLAQLHQLRGRVGRSSARSHCILMYHGPLSEAARHRLGVLRSIHDGFEIARRDLELRGPGELLGTRQTGLLQFRVADVMRDRALLPTVHRAADTMLTAYTEHVAPLIRRWAVDAIWYGTV
jgi:ATP-dependent DNA helicase RecG